MRYLGIDPGLSGGLAVVEAIDDAAPMLVEAIDIPTLGSGAKQRVDGIAIRKFIAKHEPALALIERAGAMPKQGVASGFKYGRAVGALETVVALCAVPIEVVEPSTWKRFFRLNGQDKEGARQYALQTFPAAHGLLARKRDHGRAEAALLALYGARQRTVRRSQAIGASESDDGPVYEVRPAWE
jgi:crossover junction endodeoxyribonuclease RuvC